MRPTIAALVAAVLLCAAAHAGASPQAERDAKQQAEVRREKCAFLWQRVNPASYARERSDFLCAEFEQGNMPAEWWYAFCNWTYASGLNPRMSCRGGGMWARGLADCTRRNGPRSTFADLGTCDLFDARVSMRNDRVEAQEYHERTGREGWALRRMVFMPRRPDCRRARLEERRWRRVEKRHRRVLAAGYAAGKIAAHGPQEDRHEVR